MLLFFKFNSIGVMLRVFPWGHPFILPKKIAGQHSPSSPFFFEKLIVQKYSPSNAFFFRYTANPIWGVICESSKLKARKSLLPRFSEKRRRSFELRTLKQHSKMSPQVGSAVHICTYMCVFNLNIH